MASSYDETLYAARLLIEAQTWPDRKRVVEERSNELFGEHIDQAFATILDQAHGCIDTIRAIEQMHTILDRCRSEGIDAAFEAFLPPTDSFTEMIEHIFEVVLSYVSAENWEERKHIVKSHSDILLSDVTGPTFDVLIDRYKEDEESLRLLEDCRALLKLCQKEGIDAAFTSFLVDLGQQIMAAVDAFVNTGTWRESKNIVETHRDKLLTDAADKVFADLIDQYREDTDAVKVLKDHRELLARCRRDGIEVAFAPYLSSRTQIQSPSRQVVEAVQAFVRAGTPIQQKQIVETRRDVLLTDEAEQVLTILIRRSANDPEASQLFRKHLNLLMHCRREGIDAAFANLLGYDHKIIDALLAFSRADTWEGRKDIVEAQHEALLSDQADQMLADMLEHFKGDHAMVRLLEDSRDLLERCRRMGIAAAFANRSGSTTAPTATSDLPVEAVLSFVNAKTWGERKRIVEDRRDELLSDAADQVFTILLEQSKGHATMVRKLEDCRAVLARCRQEGPDVAFADRLSVREQIGEALLAFTQAPGWEERKHIVERWRDLLLTDEADEILAGMLEHYEGDSATARIAQLYRALLARCRQEGIDAAFADYLPPSQQVYDAVQAFITADTWEQSKRVVETRQNELLSNSADKVFATLIERHKDDVRVVTLLKEHHALLAQCRRQGIDAAFADLVDHARTPSAHSTPEVSSLVGVIQSFVLAPNWIESRRVVEKHPELLNEDAIVVLGQFVEKARSLGDEAGVRLFDEHYTLLLRCCEVGIEQAFSEKLGGTARSNNSDIPPELRDRLLRIAPLNEQQRRDRRFTQPLIAELESLLHDLPPNQYISFRADILNKLGACYRELTGNRAENLQSAIAYYEQVLILPSFDRAASAYIAALNDLGVCYVEMPIGDRTENLQRAIAHYEHALSIISSEHAPDTYATLQTNLGNAYCSLPVGDLGANLQHAITCYNEALRFRSPEHSPRDYAQTQNSLGQAYAQLPSGDLATNLQLAIDAFQEALRFRSPETAPLDYAMTQHNLGSAYKILPTGNIVANLQRAIDCYERVLTIYTPEVAPLDYAMAQHDLGSVYRTMPTGDRAINLHRAIKCYQEALRFRTLETIPTGYAQTQFNLGNAYVELPTGDRDTNLQRAITCFEQALLIFTPEAAPREYAKVQAGLGIAYADLTTGDRDTNLQRAITCFEQALSIFTSEAVPREYATVQAALGNAYMDFTTGDRDTNLQRAIICFEQALSIFTPEAAPREYATVQAGLGNAYTKLSNSGHATYPQHAITCFEQALTILTPETAPRECRTVGYNLSTLYVRQEEWEQAHIACKTAVRAAEALYRSAVVPISQQGEVGVNTRIYDLMITICLKLRDDPARTRDALIYAEGGKARTFLDQMGQASFPPPPDAPAALLIQEQELIAQLRQLEQVIAVSTADDEIHRQLATQRQTLRDELEQVWETLGRESPSARDYIALRRALSPTWDDVHRLAARLGSEAALVEFYMLSEEVIAFVLRAGWSEPQIFALPLSSQRLLYRYLLSYSDEILNHQRLAESGREPMHAWLDLGEELLAPLETVLTDARLVYFVPHRWLHVFPLHALTVCGQPFIARHACAYAPSMAVLARTLEHTPSTAELAALVMGYTSNPNQFEQALFLGEAQGVADLFSCQPLLGDGACTHELRQQGPKARSIHLSCHGGFNSDQPLTSAVTLADGNFTARDWMQLKLDCDIVTLSACQTGFSEVSPGDEIVGLTRALLYAGASSTLLTLWSVNAATTLEWMLNFYGQTRNSTANVQYTKAEAFQQATLNLHQAYRDPYYWAPFVLAGSWR